MIINKKVAKFNVAYDSYFSTIKKYAFQNCRVLEIGGGAHPSINERNGLNYHVVDPDQKELSKLPADIIQIGGNVQSMSLNQTFDLIISKMVLEHVPDPDEFHKKVSQLLTPNGRAIHFFACRHSLPAFVNRFLPEKFGEALLKILKNRQLDDSPKYEAYYRRTLGHTKAQLTYFQKMGFGIEVYYSFVGHKYFKNFPLIKLLERAYTSFLSKMEWKRLSTVALVVLKKINERKSIYHYNGWRSRI